MIKRLLGLISAVAIGSSALAMTKSEYGDMTTQYIQTHFEEIKSGDEYLYKLKQRLKSRPPAVTDPSLTTKDFELYEKKIIEKEFERFQRNKKALFKKISEYTHRSKKLNSSKILKSWMEFSLTKNEKESLSYLLSLRYKTIEKETPSLEADIINLMHSFSTTSVQSYQKCGYTFAESMYARHMALYNKILESMKTNFDPVIYFHIESCMHAEEKFLIQSHYDEELTKFAHSEIASKTHRDDKLKSLLRSYFEKRKNFSSSSEFIYSS